MPKKEYVCFDASSATEQTEYMNKLAAEGYRFEFMTPVMTQSGMSGNTVRNVVMSRDVVEAKPTAAAKTATKKTAKKTTAKKSKSQSV